jgi:hypothetical protein
VTADDDAKARELVAALGNPYFPAREEAFLELRELGRLALPAIVDAIENSQIPEVARRCELLQPRAYALEVRARVDCFSADTAGRFKHDLPGADQFFAITGRTPAARQLYRDLLLSPNRDLVTSVGQPNDEVAERVNARRAELTPRRTPGVATNTTQASADDVIAVLFVESTIPDGGGGVGVNAPTYLLTQSQLRTALDSDPRREALAAITARWLDTRTDVRTLSLAMSVAATLRQPVVPLARKLLANEKATPSQRATALCKVAQAGTLDDLAVFAPLLDNEAVAFNGVIVVNGQRQNNPIQLRDVALAMSLLLAKKEPIDYGMTSRYPGTPSDSLKYSYYNFFFDDQDGKAEERRAEAVGRWYEWAGKNVKGYPKAPPPKEKQKKGDEKKEEKKDG